MDEEKKLQEPEITHNSGEKGFALVLLVIGLFFTWQSYLMFREEPVASSYGAVPLFCSGIITLLALVILITDRKKRTPGTGKPLKEALLLAVRHVAGKDVLVMIGLIILYCLALYLGSGFMIATPIFLWVGMTWLSRGNYLKNILWTAICMGFIYLVFKVLFSVVLP